MVWVQLPRSMLFLLVAITPIINAHTTQKTIHLKPPTNVPKLLNNLLLLTNVFDFVCPQTGNFLLSSYLNHYLELCLSPLQPIPPHILLNFGTVRLPT